MSRMLAGRLTIGQIDDLEALCRSITATWLRQHKAYLAEHEHDDLLAFVLAEAALFARDHDASANGTLAGLVAAKSHHLCVEWYRARFGRTGHRRPQDGQVWEDIDSAVAGETADRPLRGLFGLARPWQDAVCTAEDRLILVESDLTAKEVAERYRLSPKQVSRRRREMRDRLRHLDEAV